ncbi:hypothetical protein NQ318_003070 [Aromia moschata]|uniref:Uncharacterized protein n=1 Tax=Aromia moschata TaxID=1265417 RepID=A0AAV8Y594_9CUCU|nr:hypothetical protein NQ318_003070 [Aromia moschata]
MEKERPAKIGLEPVNGKDGLPIQTEIKRHGNKKVFIFKDLAITPQQPYEGPFPVVQRGYKTFLVRIHVREKHISMDRLKPAYLINDQVDPLDRDPEDDPVIIPQREETAAPRREPEPTPATPGPVRTRYGRRVRFPDRYQAGFLWPRIGIPYSRWPRPGQRSGGRGDCDAKQVPYLFSPLKVARL